MLFRSIMGVDRLAVPLRLAAPGVKYIPSGLRLHDFESAEEETREAKRQARLAKFLRLRFPGSTGLLAADSKCLEQTLSSHAHGRAGET